MQSQYPVQRRRPTPASQVVLPAFGGAARRVERKAAVQALDIQRQAIVGQARVETIARVGAAALDAQTYLSARQQMLVEMEPSAVHGLAHLSQRLTLGLGRAIDQTVNDVVDR